MQAILPDLNTAYITYRRQIIISLGSKNYNSCFGSLYAINGLLPDKYRIIISDNLYKEAIKQIVFAKCNHCTTKYEIDNPNTDSIKYEERPTEIEFETVRVYEVMLPMLITLVSGNTIDKVWDCPKCFKVNRLSITKYVRTTIKEPYFLQIVPKPPNRKDGLTDRSTYDRITQRYIWTFLDELEHQMGKYRQEYQPKEGESNELNIDENGDLENYS